MIWKLVTWFLSGPLDRILSSIDNKVDNETQRDALRIEAVKAALTAQVAMMSGPGRWFMWLFIAPLGFWWTAVCVYSVLWCQKCAYPQSWSIAALPPPLDGWAGAIITSLFAGGFMVQSVKMLRR